MPWPRADSISNRGADQAGTFLHTQQPEASPRVLDVRCVEPDAIVLDDEKHGVGAPLRMTSTCEACACLAALVMASCAMR